MVIKTDFHLIIQGPEQRNVTVVFTTMEINSMPYYAAYPYPLEELRNYKSPLWGHGSSHEAALLDLIIKWRSDMIDGFTQEIA